MVAWARRVTLTQSRGCYTLTCHLRTLEETSVTSQKEPRQSWCFDTTAVSLSYSIQERFTKCWKNWWSIKPQTLAFILNLPYVLLTSMTSNSVKGFLVLSKIYQQFLPEKICVESTKLEFSGRDAWCQNDPSVFWRNFALESAYLGWSLPPSGKAFCLFNVAGRWYAPSKKDCLVFGHKFEEKSLIKLSKKTCSLRWIW